MPALADRATPAQQAAYTADKKIVRQNFRKAFAAYKAANQGLTAAQRRQNRRYFWNSKGTAFTAGLQGGRVRGTDLTKRTSTTGLRKGNPDKYGTAGGWRYVPYPGT